MNKLTKTKPDDLKVFISSRDSTCDECKETLGHHAWIMLHGDKGALGLSCADLDHLVFLPSGDAALTRNSKKHSGLSAVVLKWSKARKHYERQGLLVESEAVEKAETECEATAHQREIRRARAMLRRVELDHDYIHQFAERVREMYPQCPDGREQVIAEHACRKYSGRVGRSADAKDLAKKQSGWLSSRTFVTQKLITTNSSAPEWIAQKHGCVSGRMSLRSLATGSQQHRAQPDS